MVLGCNIAQLGVAFTTVWKVVPRSSKIKFFVKGSFIIDWGDGSWEQITTGGQTFGQQIKHNYLVDVAREYTVSIMGINKGESITFSAAGGTVYKLIEIKQWGQIEWGSMRGMFEGACNMVCTATDVPDLSKVENISFMFYNCSKFNVPIEHWQMSTIKYMDNMFAHAITFNQPLAQWDLSAAETVKFALNNTPAFNQDLRDLKINADTSNMFGMAKSLVDYNEKHAEEHEAKNEKQEVLQVLGTRPA